MAAPKEAKVTNVYIQVNGQYLAQPLMSKLKGIIVESALGYPDTFTISFNDNEVVYIDQSLSTFAIGNSIKIYFMAYKDEKAQIVFDGEITSIAPEFDESFAATLVVSGYDKSHRLMRGTKSRTFLNQSDTDVVKKIAAEAGLSPSVDTTTTTRNYIVQHNQTNMDFLKELAIRNGYLVYVEGTTLYFKKGTTNRGEVTLKWGDSLTSFRPRLSAARQVDTVNVRSWDSSQQKEIVGVATSSSSHPSINVGGSGMDVGRKAFGSATHVEVRQAVADAKDANNKAQAILDEINSEFVEAEGLADGNPNILAGSKVKIEKVGNLFSGTYHVTNAKHFLDKGIYKTEFRVEGTYPYLLGGVLENGNSDRTQNYPLWAGVYPALVTNNTDPDKLNRVKVKYPWLDNTVESDWARVVTVGAGKQMGSHWLPEVNDEVLVAFEHGNFNRPYVLGGVYSQAMKPPSESQNGNPIDKRVMKSRSGNMIIMDDTQGKENIILQTAKGHIVTMDDSAKSITIKSQGSKSIIIDDTNNKVAVEGAATVDIKSTNAINIEGTNITIKGTATVKVEAPSVDVNGTGTVKIAGGMIQIG